MSTLENGLRGILEARGLAKELVPALTACLDEFDAHEGKNTIKERYYDGKVRLSEVNLGLALPQSFSNLEIGCAWGAKTVDVLASRSMLDSFVDSGGGEAEVMIEIVRKNRLLAEYQKACRDELKFGCDFITLSPDKDMGGCRIRFHSARSAAAKWSGEKGRIAYGFAIIATETGADGIMRPVHVNFYTDLDTWEIFRDGAGAPWVAERKPHIMGRPLMEPLIYDATTAKPFGRSRIKEPIRRLIEGYVRTIANATIGLEFATSPQKYLLGVTDQQFDEIVNDKFRQYVGSIIAATTNPETGEKPTFGQLQQGTIEPHVQMLRILATQFSAATGLTVTDTGVVNDANPTSSDAILAQSQTLILMAEQLNAANGEALATVARMALAIARGVRLEDLSDDEKGIIPHFKNPAMPSVAVTADAATKIASMRQGFASTDIYLEMVGFSAADIRRIKAQETRAAGMAVLMDEFAEPIPADEGET